jgi:putative membrane protein
MKPKVKFISVVAIVAIVGALPLLVSGQGTDEHATADNPHLRRTPTPGPSGSAAQATSLSQKDQKFLSQIAAGGVQAVKDSEVAEKQGGPAVKSVAARIVSERGRSNTELTALAKKKGLSLATDKIQARNMGKSSFDKQYAHTLTRDAQEDVKLLQTAASSSDDKDIKAWAAKTLPMVKGELAALQGIK